MFRQFQKRLHLYSATNLCWYHIPSSPRLTYTYALIPLNCDAPNPAPKLGVDRGCHTFNCDWDSLTFSLSELTPAFICTISIITKILLFIYTYHHSGIHYILYTYTRVPLLLLLQFHYYKTIHIKSEIAEQCGEHLSLRWHVLLMWDVLSSILVFCFCTYTD